MIAFLKIHRYAITAFIIIGLALFYRLLLLEMMPDLLHPDHGMISLMSKHILEKGEFPLFWYGQNWFGPLMAFVDALYFFGDV